MDFGKLPSVDQVDFSLPAAPDQNIALLAGLSKPAKQTLYIGPTGYNMKPWVGKWYPPGAKEKDFLRHYAAQFNTIEHNTTHYRIPDLLTVSRWRSEVGDDFRFCPKIPQTISHAPDLGLSGKEMQIFSEAILGLDERLGSCFMQLPPQFSPRDLRILARFLETYAGLIPLSVEVRHAAFFQNGEAGVALFSLLQNYGVSAVITDVAGRRDVCHLRLTNERTLIRFVGNSLHPTDYSRITAWAAQIKAWFDAGLHEVYFFTHEPDNLLAPELAVFCAETFRRIMPHVEMKTPKMVGGQQGSLF